LQATRAFQQVSAQNQGYECMLRVFKMHSDIDLLRVLGWTMCCLQVKLADGNEVTAYPHLFSYVVDDPEGKDVTCIKGGQSNHPCELCWVSQDQLSNVTIACAERTIPQQQAICDGILQAQTTADKAAISAERSTHPVKSCLWGWRFGDLEGPTNMMLCVGYDSMHNDDLGVWCYIVEHVGAYLTAKKGKSEANQVGWGVTKCLEPGATHRQWPTWHDMHF
jgi:hypothetical protein